MGLKNIIDFLGNKKFLKQLLYLFAFVIFLIVAAIQWLKYYTHHGQKLEMPNYIGINHVEAKKDAEKKSFVLIVEDSLHIVGKPGGEIIDQNPKPTRFNCMIVKYINRKNRITPIRKGILKSLLKRKDWSLGNKNKVIVKRPKKLIQTVGTNNL